MYVVGCVIVFKRFFVSGIYVCVQNYVTCKVKVMWMCRSSEGVRLKTYPDSQLAVCNKSDLESVVGKATCLVIQQPIELPDLALDYTPKPGYLAVAVCVGNRLGTSCTNYTPPGNLASLGIY